MSKRAFSRSFDMPTIDPDKEDETPIERMINIIYDKLIKGSYIKLLDEETVNCPVIEKVESKKGCDHSWKSYVGLSESFHYCEHCDEKR